MVFAILNQDNICMGLSELLEDPRLDNYISIEKYDSILMGKKYENGEWIGENLLPKNKDAIEILQEENKQLKDELKVCQQSIAELTALAMNTFSSADEKNKEESVKEVNPEDEKKIVKEEVKEDVQVQ